MPGSDIAAVGRGARSTSHLGGKMREGGPGSATWALARAFYSSIAWYARVQKSVITRGGTGDSIIRWVRRMPARFSRGSEQPAVPMPPTHPNRYRAKIDALRVDAHAESPARLESAVAVAEEHLHAFLLRVGQMIHRHERDRRKRKDSRAPIPAFAEHHAAKGEIVVGGRNEPAAA